MSRPTPDATRVAIAAAYKEHPKAQAIASRFGVSRQTVVNVAKAAGLYKPAKQLPAQDVGIAREVRLERVRVKRLSLMEDLLDDAVRLRKQFWQPVRVYKFGGKDNDFNSEQLDEPDFDGKLKLSTTISNLVDKTISIGRQDMEEEAGSKAAIVALVDAMTQEVLAEAAEAPPAVEP